VHYSDASDVANSRSLTAI